MSVLLISVQRNLDIIGLKLLHHLLLEKGHRSYLLYLPQFDGGNNHALGKLKAFVEGISPKLIGVSLMAIDYADAVTVTRHLKTSFPDVPIVWGGIHATTAPEICARHADYVCVGEGEQTLLDLADAAETGRPLTSIRNVGYRQDGQFRQNPLYPLVQDLDTLPVPSQISPNSFVQFGSEVLPLDVRHLRQYKRYNGGVYKVLTSRGCPYGCTYCCNHFLRRLYGTWEIRRRSAGHVMAELERAVKEGPRLEYVDFSDDCFLAAPLDYLRDFCGQYKVRIGKPFIAKATPRYVTREKLDLLAQAGLAWINLGLQSGSERVCLEVYQRAVTPEEFLDAARLIREYPVAAYYDVIVDNPFESVEDSIRTAETLMATPRPFYTLMFSLSFYPGTELFERAVKECPEKVQDGLQKDYRILDRQPVNALIEIASLLPVSLMRPLIEQFRRSPQGALTRLALFLAAWWCRIVLSPITYFRLIRRTQRGSTWRTLRVLPIYLRDGLNYYFNRFNWFKRQS